MANEQSSITETDREWVHQSFEWLIKNYGYPSSGFQPYLFTKEFFPATLNEQDVNIGALLHDLCNLFKIDPSIISFKIEKDIRDTHGTPFEIHGEAFESELDFIREEQGYHYTFYFANSILKNPKRILFHSVFRFIQIKLSSHDIGWIESGDHYYIFFLIGIYTGWGVILAQTMTDVGKRTDGFWQRTWKYISPMPTPVMTYALALHCAMREEIQPFWVKYLPADMQVQFEQAISLIGKEGFTPVISKQELTATNLYKESFRLSDGKDFDRAIENCQKALFMTQDENLKGDLYNHIGYTLLLKGDFKKAIASFQKALELDSNITYAYDNLSFAFIMLGDTDTGKYYHSLAADRKRVKAYAFRNLALYHQKRGENELARQYFRQAFEHITIPVDWLEYLYARFLDEQGEKEEALLYLQVAVDRGEPFAIQWMKELSG